MSVRGLESFVEVIDLLKNPTKYDAKIEELKQAYQNYKDAVESVTKLSEVNEYTLNIREKSAKIDETYAKAKQESEDLLKSIKAEQEQARLIAKKEKELLKERETKVKASEEQQLQIAKEQSAFAEKLEQKSVELTKRQVQLDELEKELSERKAKLLAVFA